RDDVRHRRSSGGCLPAGDGVPDAVPVLRGVALADPAIGGEQSAGGDAAVCPRRLGAPPIPPPLPGRRHVVSARPDTGGHDRSPGALSRIAGVVSRRAARPGGNGPGAHLDAAVGRADARKLPAGGAAAVQDAREDPAGGGARLLSRAPRGAAGIGVKRLALIALESPDRAGSELAVACDGGPAGNAAEWLALLAAALFGRPGVVSETAIAHLEALLRDPDAVAMAGQVLAFAVARGPAKAAVGAAMRLLSDPEAPPS